MNNRKILHIVLVALLCVMFMFIDWFQWDVIVRIKIIYTSLAAGLFHYAVIGLKIIILIRLIVLSIRYIKLNYADSKILSLIPMLIVIFTITVQFVIIPSNIYAKCEYYVNKNRREEVISMLTGYEKTELIQTNIDTYMLPFKLRLASHDAKVVTEQKGNNLKVLFYAHRGMKKNSAIIYVSDTSKVINGDFDIKYAEILPMDTHWFLANYNTRGR